MKGLALTLATLLVCGCASPPAAESVAAPHVTYPDKAFDLTCGAERVQVHFTDMEAHYSSPEGGILNLERLDGGPATYTNGRVTITRDGDGSKITFARGRMAAQSCADR